MTISGRGATAGGTARPLRTADVARAAGCSVQQVRDLEALGVLPPADRSTNGYRAFGDEHVLALRAYRGLAAAVGPVVARRVLRDARSLPLAEAAALVSGLHVTLAREREEALAARRALLAIRSEGDGAAASSRGSVRASRSTRRATNGPTADARPRYARRARTCSSPNARYPFADRPAGGRTPKASRSRTCWTEHPAARATSAVRSGRDASPAAAPRPEIVTPTLQKHFKSTLEP